MKHFNKKSIQNNMDRLANCFPHLTKFPYTYDVNFKGKQKKKNIFEDIAKKYDQLAYPNHPNWSYCIPIIPAFERKGKTVDIGLHIKDDLLLEDESTVMSGLSSNIVYSNEEHDYGSGGPGIFSVYDKQLMLELHKLEIISRQDLINQLDFNGLLMNFYNSNLTGFDLLKLIQKG